MVFQFCVDLGHIAENLAAQGQPNAGLGNGEEKVGPAASYFMGNL